MSDGGGPRAGTLGVTLTMTGTRAIWEANSLGPQHCEGIRLLEEEPVEKDLSIDLEWSSEETVIPVPKGKKTREETRWVTTTTRANGTLDGVDLNLPFGDG